MNSTLIQKEIRYRNSRSSGSGGQHVNKVETRVELLFDLNASKGLNEKEVKTLKLKLKSRINKDQILIISAQKSRSQVINRREATKRFFVLINKALSPEKARKGPPVLKANAQKRRKDKQFLSEKKALRRKISL